MKNISLLLSKAALLVFISLLFNYQSVAQRKEDVLYLKNGSIVHGKIELQSDTSKIKFITYDKNIWFFNVTEVDKWLIEKVPLSILPDHGFNFNLDFGILGGNGVSQNIIPVSLIGTYGYHFNPFLGVGLATGLEAFDNLEMPALLDVRFNLIRRKSLNRHSNLFVQTQAGYVFTLGSQNESEQVSYTGGKAGNISLGVRTAIRPNFALDFSLGYRHQELKSKTLRNNWGQGYYEEIHYYNRIIFKIGIEFY